MAIPADRTPQASGSVDQKFPRLPLCLSLVIAALLALQVSGLAWSVVHKPGEANRPPTDLQPRHPLARLNVGQVVAAHLFGQVAADPSKVVPTTLSLQLVGTWADSSPGAGMALVREADGAPQRLVHVGEELPGGARLREVYGRRIVFERDGKYEDLAFPENPLHEADPPSMHAVESMQVEEGAPAERLPSPMSEAKPRPGLAGQPVFIFLQRTPHRVAHP
jgi:type II secretory pathway component PulC